MGKVIEVDSVLLEFGLKKVLSDIYMRFEQGQVSGMLGRNGAGKSCLMKIIYGISKATNASIRFDGCILKEPFKHPGTIRYMPQSSFIPKFLRIKNVFDLFGVDNSLFITDFPEFADDLNTHFRDFSFGQKRLIETYLILKSHSDFVLLDEPFSYLMPVHVERLKEIIMCEKNLKGIVITDHLYKELIDITDILYLIDDGKSRLIKHHEELAIYGYLN